VIVPEHLGGAGCGKQEGLALRVGYRPRALLRSAGNASD
jgi:hypothetical protein